MSAARKIGSSYTRQLDHHLTAMLSAQTSRPNFLEVCPPSLPSLVIPTRNASRPRNGQLTLAPARFTYNSIEVKDISLVDYINVQHAVYVRKSYIAQLGGILSEKTSCRRSEADPPIDRFDHRPDLQPTPPADTPRSSSPRAVCPSSSVSSTR
jgi:hypothetical protein